MLRPRKLLIYLDQNYLSNLAKVDLIGRVPKEYLTLRSRLQAGFAAEKLVVLASVTHSIESDLTPNWKEHIKDLQASIGHTGLCDPMEIKECQIARGIQVFIGCGELKDVIFFEDAFEDWPDRPVPLFQMDLRQPSRSAKENERRVSLAARLDPVRRRVRDGRIRFPDLYKDELNSMRSAMTEDKWATHYAAVADVDLDTYSKFVSSDAFSQIPIINLEVALLAQLMSTQSNRSITPSDVPDMDTMAAYLPYCDMYATDKTVANVARNLKLPNQYACQIFDASLAGVESLSQAVHRHIETSEPVNIVTRRPLF